MHKETLGNGSYRVCCLILDHIAISLLFGLSLENAWLVLVVQSKIVPEKICCLLLPGGPSYGFEKKIEAEIAEKSDICCFRNWLTCVCLIGLIFPLIRNCYRKRTFTVKKLWKIMRRPP